MGVVVDAHDGETVVVCVEGAPGVREWVEGVQTLLTPLEWEEEDAQGIEKFI